LHPENGSQNVPRQAVGQVDAQGFLDDLYRLLSRPTNRRPATILRFHTVLRAFFARAVLWDWIDRNRVVRATPPRV